MRSDHGVQKDPLAIQEVHRILYEHLGLTPARSTMAAPVAAETNPSSAVR